MEIRILSFRIILISLKLTTIKDVERDGSKVGYLAITEIANDIKTATDERKAFVIRTAISVGFVILIFSLCTKQIFYQTNSKFSSLYKAY